MHLVPGFGSEPHDSRRRPARIGRGRAWGFLTGVLCGLSAHASAPAAEVSLAKRGQPVLAVVIRPGSPPAVQQAANELRDLLGRITGGTFASVESEQTEGIVLRVADPVADAAWLDPITDPVRRREAYRLRSHPGGLDVAGATPLAVEQAVWALLHRLGHRQFFPGQAWEVVPREPNLAVDVDLVESPDYSARRIWYTYGTWPENRDDFARWLRCNRMPGGFGLNTGHAYGGIIRRNQAAFDAHPEYYALNKGVRRIDPEAKFCIGNPGLRQLVVADALAAFARNPELDTVSVDPSDGGNWCECDRCKAIGRPSDLALTLANDVSEALEARGLDKYVAMYAYNEHGPPPSIRARERVIVTVATAFLRGGFSVDQIIDGWLAQGVRRFGIREYYSIIHWDRDLPGAARAGRLHSLAESITRFHARGARYLSAESSENFGPNGLGYYLAARIMWNVKEADRLEPLVDDFLDKAFGTAREPMRRYYDLIVGPERPLLSADLVGRMYGALAAASAATGEPAVRARIDDLSLYTRYVELFLGYSEASGAARKAAHEALIRHSYRMRRSMMVHSLAHYRTGFRDPGAPIPPDARWKVPEPRNPWKSGAPWSRDELTRMVQDGLANNPLRAFAGVDFSEDLVPATPLKLTASQRLDPGARGRGTRYFFTWVERPPATLSFAVTGGLIAHYRDRGPARLELQVFDGDTGDYETIDHGESAPDGVTRTVALKTDRQGLHRLRISDGMDATQVAWPAGYPRTAPASLSTANHVHGRSGYVFYVPRGTAVVGGYVKAGGGTLHDADGRRVADLGDETGFFHVPVEPRQDGRLWSVQNLAGSFRLMTVPPYVAGRADELMLPREVVAQDARP